MPTETVLLGVRFSPESNLYTYKAKISWVKDLAIGDFLIVPVRDGTMKVVKFTQVVHEMPSGMQESDLKWIVQRVNPALIQRAKDADNV